MYTTAGTSAAQLPETKAAPVKLLRRIGSTTYQVSVYFSETSKDTMGDKIIRLIEMEAAGQ